MMRLQSVKLCFRMTVGSSLMLSPPWILCHEMLQEEQALYQTGLLAVAICPLIQVPVESRHCQICCVIMKRAAFTSFVVLCYAAF